MYTSININANPILKWLNSFYSLPISIILFFPLVSFAQDSLLNEPNPIESLEGTWVIDLRPSADADPYLKEFTINLNNDSSFIGEFYGSPILNGLINSNWQKIYFAFSTKDQNNEYFHSAYLLDGKIYGITYCLDRAFVVPWNGTKKE